MDQADVDALYALPLDQFVAERNRLAKEHKDPDLKKLRKPSVAAWTANQLARSHGDEIQALVDAAASLRAAQGRAVSGGRGGGADLRTATREHRAAVDALLSLASPPPSVAERVRSTLSAASLDEDLVDTLLAGRLVDDVEPAGFGDLSGLELLVTPAGEDEVEDEEDAAERAAREAAAQELADAEAALRDARRRESEARLALERAEDAVADAERRVKELTKQVKAKR